MNRRFLRVLLIIVAVFLLAGLSAPEASAQQTKTLTVLFLVADEDGRWDRELHQSLFPNPPEINSIRDKNGSPVKIAIIKASEAINSETAMAIPAGDREKLLRFPKAILASEKASTVLSADYLFTVELTPVHDSWEARGVLYSVKTGEVEYMTPRTENQNKDAVLGILKDLPESLGTIIEARDLPVTGAKNGGLYHKAGTGHITRRGERADFKNPRLARDAGFKPCPICFPGSRHRGRTDILTRQLGREMTRAIETTYIVDTSGEMARLVEELGRKLLKGNPPEGNPCRFRLLETDEVNAYCVPGGIYITRGLVDILESDDEVAGILAHEMAHCRRNHPVKMYQQARNNQHVGTAVAIATGTGWTTALSDFAIQLITAGWNREFETEADLYAVAYLRNGGFDPGEYLVAMKKLRDYGRIQKENPGWIQTHPTDDQRIEAVQTALRSLDQVIRTAENLRGIDPKVAEYITANPVNYMEDPQYLTEFARLFGMLRLTPQPGSFILIPLDQLQEDPQESRGTLAPPESLDKSTPKK